ncbi:MAG: hypothetical protein JWM80_5514 [Cyanobacteria bacterium RYN_339]|nr:hypothetical protein [Cyanobacteria bacterium RYN_339]
MFALLLAAAIAATPTPGPIQQQNTLTRSRLHTLGNDIKAINARQRAMDARAKALHAKSDALKKQVETMGKRIDAAQRRQKPWPSPTPP